MTLTIPVPGAIQAPSRASASALELSVSDDGRGLQPATGQSGGYGIAGMRERTQIGGGSLSVVGREGGGTTVALTLPLR